MMIVEQWFSPELMTRHTMLGCSFHTTLGDTPHNVWLLVFSDASRHTLECLRFRNLSRSGGWDSYTTLPFVEIVHNYFCHRDIRPLEPFGLLTFRLVVKLSRKVFTDVFDSRFKISSHFKLAWQFLTAGGDVARKLLAIEFGYSICGVDFVILVGPPLSPPSYTSSTYQSLVIWEKQGRDFKNWLKMMTRLQKQRWKMLMYQIERFFYLV